MSRTKLHRKTPRPLTDFEEEERLFMDGKYNFKQINRTLSDSQDNGQYMQFSKLNFQSKAVLLESFNINFIIKIAPPSGVTWTGTIADGLCPSYSTASFLQGIQLFDEGENVVVNDTGLGLTLANHVEHLENYSYNWSVCQGPSTIFSIDTAPSLAVSVNATGVYITHNATGASYTGPYAVTLLPTQTGAVVPVNEGYMTRVAEFHRQSYFDGTNYWFQVNAPLREFHPFWRCREAKIPFIGQQIQIKVYTWTGNNTQFPALDCPSGVPTWSIQINAPAGSNIFLGQPAIYYEQVDLNSAQAAYLARRLQSGWVRNFDFPSYYLRQYLSQNCTAGTSFDFDISSKTVLPDKFHFLTAPAGWISQTALGYSSPLVYNVPKNTIQIQFDNENYNTYLPVTYLDLWEIIEDNLPFHNESDLWGGLLSFDRFYSTYPGLFTQDISYPRTFNTRQGVTMSVQGNWLNSIYSLADVFLIVTNWTRVQWPLGAGMIQKPNITVPPWV